MAVKSGTVFVRAHPDVDPIQGLIGVETALLLKDEYRVFSTCRSWLSPRKAG